MNGFKNKTNMIILTNEEKVFDKILASLHDKCLREKTGRYMTQDNKVFV